MIMLNYNVGKLKFVHTKSKLGSIMMKSNVDASTSKLDYCNNGRRNLLPIYPNLLTIETFFILSRIFPLVYIADVWCILRVWCINNPFYQYNLKLAIIPSYMISNEYNLQITLSVEKWRRQMSGHI